MTKNTGSKRAGFPREYSQEISALYRLLAQKIITLIIAKLQAGKGLAFLVNTAKKGRPFTDCRPKHNYTHND